VAGGIELVRFAQSLSSASSFDHLERRFLAGFGRLMGIAMYGYDLIDPITERPTCIATANVSPTFVARYELDGRDVDPVLEHSYATRRPTYNRALMSAQEWEESEVYRHAYRLHAMRHVVEVPVESGGRVAGNLHFAASEPDRDFAQGEIDVAKGVADVLGMTIEGLETLERLSRERDQALAALELTGTAVVISDQRTAELELNGPAQRLVADVDDAEEWLHRLLARMPIENGGFSRRVEVVLATGEVATIHAHVSPVPHDHGALVAVLELEREQPHLSPARLSTLTPREREVAGLVVDGLGDREIAERLHLSHHTVSQYVKRIYRKLAVDSRVALTRVLLTRDGAS
jgi:DNA-binding NarL/FixJ family response regulator